LTVKAKAKNLVKDCTAGYTIRLDPFVGQDKLVQRNYLTLSNKKWGTFDFGNLKGPHEITKFAQGNIPTGWVDSGMDEMYYNTTGYYDGVAPVGHTHTATKLMWTSPSWKVTPEGELTVAFAYTPNTGHRGRSARNDVDTLSVTGNTAKGNEGVPGYFFNNKDQKGIWGSNHVEFAVAYKHQLNCDWKLWLGAAYLMDKSQIKLAKPAAADGALQTVNHTRSFMLSALFSFKEKYTLAVEYMNGLKSRLPGSDKLSKTGGDALVGVGGIVALEGSEKGRAGQAINTVFRWDIDDINTLGLGCQYSWAKPTDKVKVSRTVFTTSYTRKLMAGVHWYLEANVLNTKTVDGNTEANKDYKSLVNALSGDEKKFVGNNRGFLVVTGICVKL